MFQVDKINRAINIILFFCWIGVIYDYFNDRVLGGVFYLMLIIATVDVYFVQRKLKCNEKNKT